MNTYTNFWMVSSLLQLLSNLNPVWSTSIGAGDGPLVAPDYVLTKQNEAVIIDVLQNDFDPDQLGVPGKEALIIKDFTYGKKGSVELINNDDGYDTLKYTPYLDECGEDLFAYIVEDTDDGLPGIGMVYIGILCTPIILPFITQDPTTTTDPNDPYNAYATSLNDWNSLKLENDCYSYTVTTVSWTGYRTATIIKVEDGTVIRRSYEAFNDIGRVESYDETKPDEIGANTAGASPLTMDELYTECYDDLETANSDDSVSFTTFDDYNILKTCGYKPDNCMDDCFFGVRLSAFEFCDVDQGGEEEEEEEEEESSPMIKQMFWW